MSATATAPPREFLRANAVYGYGNFVGCLAAATGLLLLARTLEGPVLGVVVLLIGLTQYRLSIVLHDCVHMSLFERRRVNAIVGVISAACLWTLFTNFRAGHLAHHKYYRTQQDPSLPDYGIQPQSRRDLIWFIVQPLVGAGVFVKLYQLWQHRDSRVVPTSAPRMRLPWIEVAALVVVQTIIAIVAGIADRGVWSYLILWVLPNATVMLFLSRLRTLLEHGDGGVEDIPAPRCGRTTFSNWLEQNILSPMNFNYHYWHHKYPAIPSNRLPELHSWFSQREALRDQAQFGNQEARTFWETFKRVYGVAARRELRERRLVPERRA